MFSGCLFFLLEQWTSTQSSKAHTTSFTKKTGIPGKSRCILVGQTTQLDGGPCRSGLMTSTLGESVKKTQNSYCKTQKSGFPKKAQVRSAELLLTPANEPPTVFIAEAPSCGCVEFIYCLTFGRLTVWCLKKVIILKACSSTIYNRRRRDD